MKAMSDVIQHADLVDHGIVCEYQLPLTSRRLDVMITGTNQDSHPTASIVELKQWEGAQSSEVEECVKTWVGGNLRNVLHPSVQVGLYQRYLLDTHEAFTQDSVSLRAAAFLHNFQHDPESELYARKHANYLTVNPLFAGSEVEGLSEWLHDHLSEGAGIPVLETVLRGRYRPSKKLMAHVAQIIKEESDYVLLDEQRVVFNEVLAQVAEAHRVDTKSVFIIKGGPGTGKSVIALNLVGELSDAGYVVHHATGSKAFTTNLRKKVGNRAAQSFKYFNSYLAGEENVLDVLVLDEAHRIREVSHSRFTPKEERTDEPQIDELIRVAKVAVFFIDDDQVVRPGETGSTSLIRDAAERTAANVYERELETQFRCGGSDEFVGWVENTLGIERTPTVIWDGSEEFDFDIVESPRELQALVNMRHTQGHTARLVAGFCWKWSDPDPEVGLTDDVAISDEQFAMPWNAKSDKRGDLPGGVPPSDLWATEDGGVNQIGCIYTAQGFEFDYVGVIFGKDLVYRPGEGWVGQPKFSEDRLVRSIAKADLNEFTRLVKNTYRVLLTRGLKGCYVWFQDEGTRNFFLSRIEERRAVADSDRKLRAEIRASSEELETVESGSDG